MYVWLLQAKSPDATNETTMIQEIGGCKVDRTAVITHLKE